MREEEKCAKASPKSHTNELRAHFDAHAHTRTRACMHMERGVQRSSNTCSTLKTRSFCIFCLQISYCYSLPILAIILHSLVLALFLLANGCEFSSLRFMCSSLPACLREWVNEWMNACVQCSHNWQTPSLSLDLCVCVRACHLAQLRKQSTQVTIPLMPVRAGFDSGVVVAASSPVESLIWLAPSLMALKDYVFGPRRRYACVFV